MGSFALIVLMGEPFEATDRGEADREEAAYLRGCAARAFDAGANALLMIPPLPPGLAARALEPVRQAAGAVDEPTLASLLRLADRVRQAIVTRNAGGKLDRDSVVEMALDVTLFARHDVERSLSESPRWWEALYPGPTSRPGSARKVERSPR